MERQELLIYYAGKWKRIEAFNKEVIDVKTIFAFAFLLEIEERAHLQGFVISSQHDNALRKIQLKSEH